jgi:hypothetical protein
MKTISLQGMETIEKYLNIAGKPAQYYLHKRQRFGFFQGRVFIGKGSPEEMVTAIHQNQDRGRQIGIDCSGFVCHIIDSTQPVTSVIRHPSSTLLYRLRFLLRPIENISVRVLIHPINAVPVTDVSQIQPWDLIHMGERHVMIVYCRDSNTIRYAHASRAKQEVVVGKIAISAPTSSLGEQTWSEDFSLKDYEKYPGSGVVRLRRVTSDFLIDGFPTAHIPQIPLG